jgi:hypothetical protein
VLVVITLVAVAVDTIIVVQEILLEQVKQVAAMAVLLWPMLLQQLLTLEAVVVVRATAEAVQD